MIAETARYVRRWFVPFEELVRRSGGTAAQANALIAAGAAPGIIYSVSPSGGWWSALGAFSGKAPPNPPVGGEHWYAPAALYWLRRGRLLLGEGMSVHEAAATNRAAFCDQFLAALAEEPLARANFPTAFEGDSVDEAGARSAAEAEWAAWISGAYAVCLRSFTGQSCIAKESLARHIRTTWPVDVEPVQAPGIDALDAMERLSVWLMPFAPFERLSGTPGIAIDRMLAVLDLGEDDPFALSEGVSNAA